jgi:hypothetical protein
MVNGKKMPRLKAPPSEARPGMRSASPADISVWYKLFGVIGQAFPHLRIQLQLEVARGQIQILRK